MFSFPLFGQKETTEQFKIIQDLNIKEQSTYHFQIENSQLTMDSILRIQVLFNSMGKPLEKTVYDSTGIVACYKNYYRDDSLLIAHKTYFGQEKKPYSIAEFKRLKNGDTKSEKYYVDEKLNIKIKYKYNKQGLLYRRTTHINNKKGRRKEQQTTYYNQSNQVIKVESTGYTYPSIELEYDHLGQHLKTYRIDKKGNRKLYIEHEYNSNQQVLKRITYFQMDRKTLGPQGTMEVKAGDIQVKEFEYYQNGLIKSEKLFFNSELVAFIKHQYDLF